MEELLKLYEKVKDIHEIKSKKQKKLKDFEIITEEIRQLREEMQNLVDEEKRSQEIKNNLLENYKQITQELDQIQKQNAIRQIEESSNFIDENKIMNNKLPIDEMLKNLNEGDVESFKEECFNLISELVCCWNNEEDKTIVLCKKAVTFFKKIRGCTFYAEIKKLYYRKLSFLLAGFLLDNLTFDDNQEEVLITCKNEECFDGNLLPCYKSNTAIMNFVLDILSKNQGKEVEKMILKRDRGFKTSFTHFYNALKGTKYEKDNCENELASILQKTLINLSLKERKNIGICKNTDFNRNIFSKEFSIFAFILEYLEYNLKNIEKIICDFFCTQKIDKSLFTYSCLFSEIVFLRKTIQKKSNFNCSEKLGELQEEYFSLIIMNSGISDFNYKKDLDILKVDIYDSSLAFKEIIAFFVDDNMNINFLISYFDQICNHLIKFILDRKIITIDRSIYYSELMNYILEICDNGPLLSNFCRMKCIDSILVSNLEQVNILIENKKLCLEKNEVVKLLSSLFYDSAETNELIGRMTG